MSDPNRVRLVVDGVEYSGWKQVRIEAGIERAARSFTLAVTDKWPGADGARRIATGAKCELFVGADKVLTGFVDSVPVSFDASSVSVAVRGRSLTADLIDCSAMNVPGQWRGQKVEAIARALASQYGVLVRADVDTGPVIADHQIQPGETVFESIDRMLTLRQLLASDDGDGALVLLSAASGGAAGTALVEGVNILEADCPNDVAAVFSEYVCKGQRSASGDEELGPQATEVSGVAVSAGVRKRVLVLNQSGQADAAACKARAEYEAAIRMAKSRQVSVKVAGWRQADGSLWRPNQLVRVTSPTLGVDEELLVTEVGWSLSEGGMLTGLSLCPASGYVTRLVRSKAAGKKAGSSSGGADTWADIK